MPVLCNCCNRRVLSHSVTLNCTLWNNKVHLKCLPNVAKTDSLYVNRMHYKWFCTQCVQSLYYHNDDDFVNAVCENVNKNNAALSVEDLNQRYVNPLKLLS